MSQWAGTQNLECNGYTNHSLSTEDREGSDTYTPPASSWKHQSRTAGLEFDLAPERDGCSPDSPCPHSATPLTPGRCSHRPTPGEGHSLPRRAFKEYDSGAGRRRGTPEAPLSPRTGRSFENPGWVGKEREIEGGEIRQEDEGSTAHGAFQGHGIKTPPLGSHSQGSHRRAGGQGCYNGQATYWMESSLSTERK